MILVGTTLQGIHLYTERLVWLWLYLEIPGSFETVGHIAHLNLRDEQLEHRYLIGRVLLAGIQSFVY